MYLHLARARRRYTYLYFSEVQTHNRCLYFRVGCMGSESRGGDSRGGQIGHLGHTSSRSLLLRGFLEEVFKVWPTLLLKFIFFKKNKFLKKKSFFFKNQKNASRIPRVSEAGKLGSLLSQK